jgi:hypothetical protein
LNVDQAGLRCAETSFGEKPNGNNARMPTCGGQLVQNRIVCSAMRGPTYARFCPKPSSLGY